ncbi:hypothetical protein [Methylomonas methanica]|nr:hypothetical protein [Methylomonas methanica]
MQLTIAGNLAMSNQKPSALLGDVRRTMRLKQVIMIGSNSSRNITD